MENVNTDATILKDIFTVPANTDTDWKIMDTTVHTMSLCKDQVTHVSSIRDTLTTTTTN